MKKVSIWNKLIFILIFFSLGFYIFLIYTTKNLQDKIYPGVSINNIDLSGKTKKEAIDIIKKDLSNNLKGAFKLKDSNKTYVISFKDLNLKYDLNSTVEEALSYGKNFSSLKKFSILMNSKPVKMYSKVLYDKNKLDSSINSIEKEINKNPVNAKINGITNGILSFTPGTQGRKLNKEELLKEINNKFKNLQDPNSIIEIKVKVDNYDPKINDETLKKINSLVSSFSTTYKNSSEERKSNIRLATSSINGTLLLPGDTFSFNKIVGNPTIERGYKKSNIIVNNKVEEGIGGGLCQVSTTLYNSIIRINIKSVERKNHSIIPSYVEPGLDATVSYGSIDYKFKNTLSYPIYIEGIANNEKITFNIYSNSSLNKIKYDLVSEIHNKIPFKTVYEEDPSLPLNSQKVLQSGSFGCTANVFLVSYKDGKKISKELIYKDIYNPGNKIVKIKKL
ncbi:VanW family protein [Clostridium cochlearium]|uniref:Vancomycin B-type resistance protein vanW n=1 Tax=Clostridium cochlearium TaxID=1494 RepID=A0A240AGC5_CLOCO|nr:VanW family protein [Clostridium cochlearium]NMA58734.1 hypothetical protein [Clostridium cochlearium]NME96128.1 hypothetical protein [Clostridium cochlearium]SNV82329.1 vancomycin B-type resistance protein vanW [Clostridium cochlearium]SQB35050.1 vancomycin B-type resistance protein vanW [Clostridium cochlearium]STA93006.1 vancomycin B-type resistance protein vanW [Clostridium cochlearium]